MLQRYLIVAICLVSLLASAESIVYPHDQNLVVQALTLASAPPKLFSGSHAIPGNLGAAFTNRERFQPDLPGSGVRGNYYYRDGPGLSVKQPSLLDSILRSLFQRLPHATSRRKR